MASKTISNSAAELVPANASRKSLVIQNEDSTDTVYIKRERSEATTVSTTDHDLKLGPGSAVALNSMLDGTQAVQGRYTAVASANTPLVAVFETEDILR